MSKAELELLQEYEPVLCFSGVTGEGEDYTERFYPINVEAYLGQCTFWERRRGILRWFLRSREVTQAWDSVAKKVSPGHFASPGKARAGALASEEFSQWHFLRFIPPKEAKQEKKRQEDVKSVLITEGCLALFALPLLVATVWAWQAGVTWLAWLAGVPTVLFSLVMVYLYLLVRVSDEVAEALLGFFFALPLLGVAVWAGSAGVSWAAWLAGVLGGLVLLGGLAAYFENSLSPGAADFMTILIGLVVVVVPPLWVAVKLGWRWYLIVPAVGWLLAGLFAVLAFGGEQGLAAFLALTSPLRDKASGRAHKLCQALRERFEDEEGARYTYYGRVWPDSESSDVVLQYFLFYAFNDWRHYGGFNFHEGDWEAVFVFLKRRNGQYVPTGVGLSQHHEGDYRPWGATEKWPDNKKGLHPVIYVAAGSHANYFTSDDKPMHSLFRPGLGQKVVACFEKFRDQFLPDAEKQRQLLVSAVEHRGGQSQRQLEGRGDEAARQLGGRTARLVRKAEERPNGRGLIIGPGKPKALAEQKCEPWAERVVLRKDTPPGWVEFRGLWGLKTLLKDESGPPGPRWERAGHKVEEGDKEALKGCEGCRLYWADPFHWLKNVEEARRKSLDKV